MVVFGKMGLSSREAFSNSISVDVLNVNKRKFLFCIFMFSAVKAGDRIELRSNMIRSNGNTVVFFIFIYLTK